MTYDKESFLIGLAIGFTLARACPAPAPPAPPPGEALPPGDAQAPFG